MSFARSSRPMPAVTLKHSMIHSSQNCGSFTAVAADTARSSRAACLACCGASGGVQSSAGTRISSQPTDMKIA